MEIERRLLDCLAIRYMGQRELAGEYYRRFGIRRRQFMSDLRRVVHAVEVPPVTIGTLERHRIGRPMYWCRKDDPRKGELELAASLKGSVRDVFQVGLSNLSIRPEGSGSARHYVLNGYPERSPAQHVFAAFFRRTSDGGFYPIQPPRKPTSKAQRLAWLPAELWDAVSGERIAAPVTPGPRRR